MRARIVKREDEKIVLKIGDKLVRVPKNRLDFQFSVGDYVTIEKCEGEVFILPDDSKTNSSTVPMKEPQKTEKAAPKSISSNSAPKKNKVHVSQIPKIPAVEEAPDWITKIKKSDANYLIRFVVLSIIAIICISCAFYYLSGAAKNIENEKASALGALMFATILESIAIYSIIMYRKINRYFKSEEFLELKEKISKNTNDINELNHHIDELKNTNLVKDRVSEGSSELTSGGYNYKHSGWAEISDKNDVYMCSRQVAEKSKEHPFRYICKYFNMKPNEENLAIVEEVFNNYSAVEQGKKSLVAERNDILASIDSNIPEFIKKKAANRFLEEIGIEKINLNDQYFPTYSFQYVSSAGNSTVTNTITMDLENLEDFIEYIGDQIKWKKSVAGQRSLMTSALREMIKKRDDYTCQKCGISTNDEPHLLLEIDHIKPLSKGGMTTENNLQTLCWRCNRSKGAKTEE